MSLIDASERGPIHEAIAEYDRLGKDLFLSKYGFGPAKSYFLVYKGKYYDSKAILGVAHQYDYLGRVLETEEFSGGEATVMPILEKHGFIVKVLGSEKLPQDSATRSPLILVSSDRTAGGNYDFWEDTTGVQYHFPNNYKNKIVTGRRFIYYRGIRTKTGRRSQPEYYGAGVIGDVWLDHNTDTNSPKTNWKWYCGIEDYIPFNTPVEWKRSDGSYFEEIPQATRQVAVRQISWDVFTELSELGGITIPPVSTSEKVTRQLPDLTDVKPHIGNVIAPEKSGAIERVNDITGVGGGQNRRRSAQSKVVGDRAEEVVHKYLKDLGKKKVRWVAHDGFTPGWDIEYEDRNRTRICVEVKGSVLKTIKSFELTANEMNAADKNGSNYHIYLVGECLTVSPSIEILKDPCSLIRDGLLGAKPDLWMLHINPNREDDKR